MDRSVVVEEEVEIGSTPSPAGAKKRRRCVQSKLPWAVPRAEEANGTGAAAEEGGREESDDGEAEEKGKRKKKGKSKPRTPKKSPVTSKRAQGLRSGSKSYPDPVKSPRQKKTAEQLEVVALKVGNGKRLKVLESMASSKNCQRLKNNLTDEAKPRNAAISSDSGLNESYSVKRKVNGKSDATMDRDGPSLHADQPVCDLRLEAKVAAEENVRLSTGKQMHPFFTCWKAGKLTEAQAITQVKSRRWSALDGDYCVSCPPIHVRDKQDDVILLDWKNWVFSERTLLDMIGCSAMGNDLSVFEGSVEPFRLDTLCRKEMHLDQLLDTEKGSITSAMAILSTGQSQNLQFSHLKVHLNGNSSLSFRCGSCISNSESKHEESPQKERLASYFKCCSCWPECSLWMNKYQPENASEVCGNSESVRSLSEWLKSWHERGRQRSQNCESGEKCAIEDSDDGYENDSDMDDREEAAVLKDVLLITGPVGTGKSAAIYACAKEQGFEVIEVNASDLRNGAHVMQKFGAAMQSHGWSFGELIDPRKKHNPELLPNTVDNREADDLENLSVKMASRECEIDKNHIKCSCNVTENRSAPTQVANKTLILFEDVDTVLDEDRGFISSILQVAGTAKRPIILTSNNKNPILPHFLDRVILEFKHPSSEELLSLVQMICASENAQISAQLLEHLVRSCLGDIRKTLMLLQFWCQGKRGHTDRKMQFPTYSPLPFDIDAAHLVMPRLISWEFRSELSEKVGEEINKTISLVEEQFMEMMKQEELNSKEITNFSKTRKKTANTIQTRRKHKLKRKSSSLDCAEFSAQANDLNDFFDASDSPVTNARRKVKHRPSVILSSQSEDELCANDHPPAEIISVAPNSGLLADTWTMPSLQAQVLSDLDLHADHIYLSRRDVNVQNSFASPEMISASLICDTFKLLDASFVPESSFISEAGARKKDDLLSMAVSSNNASVCFTDFVQSTCALPGANFDNPDGLMTKSITCSESNSGNTRKDAESVYGNEEQGDSQNVVEAPSASGYQLMDESSRIDFNMRLTPGKCRKFSQEVVSVQETWRKLYTQREDLKSYLRSNKKEVSSILKCASGLADLISEADIMSSSCNPIVNDILEPSLTPSVEPDASSWYDQQLEMGSTYAQHGFCYYTSWCLSLGSEVGFQNTLDLAKEMLASSTNVMALGKLLTQGNITSQNLYDGSLHTKAPRYGISIGRELESRLRNIILSIVPARLSTTFAGIAFHEYLSFMSQISKLECSRLLKCTNQNSRRRSRQSMHYLSSGALSLSPDDVEFLNQTSCFNGVGST